MQMRPMFMRLEASAVSVIDLNSIFVGDPLISSEIFMFCARCDP